MEQATGSGIWRFTWLLTLQAWIGRRRKKKLQSHLHCGPTKKYNDFFHLIFYLLYNFEGLLFESENWENEKIAGLGTEILWFSPVVLKVDDIPAWVALLLVFLTVHGWNLCSGMVQFEKLHSQISRNILVTTLSESRTGILWVPKCTPNYRTYFTSADFYNVLNLFVS